MEQNQIIIHRGSHQIGGCATEIRTKKHRIVIDFGANLPDCDEENALTDEALVQTVFGDKNCDAVLFSHYHGDHIGLYKKIPSDVPLYIGPTAKKILSVLTKQIDQSPSVTEKGLFRVEGMQCYTPGGALTPFGDIKVMPYFVDHSALDAYMFLIEAGGKRILFTGDFREHGIAGEKGRLARTIKKYIGEVDILITEGTMLSRIGETEENPIRTEADLGICAKALFQNNKESVILISSTNLDNIMEFYHALPWEMGFVCDAYQAITSLTEIRQVCPYHNMRMLQRDLADLRDGGLVSVKYSRKGRGYVKTGIPKFNENVPPRRKAHLRRLNRLGRLLSELKNEDIPLWMKKDNQADGCMEQYVTAKDCYQELFSGLSERTRQRDFETLRRLGHQISYDFWEHCFSYNEDDFFLPWVDAPEQIDDEFLDGIW